MTLFDGYLMVDWSSAATPRTGKDSIWLALDLDGTFALENPPTRMAARDRIAAILRRAAADGHRILAGFDFPFGYPAGLSRALGPEADWRDVWARLHTEIEEGEGNANNRFDAAAIADARPSNPACVTVFGSSPSITVTDSPACDSARAATAPTKPPPITKTSERCTFVVIYFLTSAE